MKRTSNSMGWAVLALCAACSNSSNGADDLGPACLGELLLGCGQSCLEDSDCSAGLYCGAGGECSADCAVELPCDQGSSCTENGTCRVGVELDAGGDAEAGADGGSEGGAEDACIDTVVEFEEQIPSVLLLVDWSGSMAETIGASTTRRWDAVQEALVDPQSGVVAQLQHRVRFGILLYTSDNGNEHTCPILEGEDIPIRLDNYAPIAKLFADVRGVVRDDTPTAEAIIAARAELVAFQAEGPKLLVLATDGDPDSCADPDANGQSGPKEASQNQVEMTYEAGIETRVIAVGENTVEQTHLQNLANAGAGFPTDGQVHATAYEPDDPAALVRAFRDIIGEVRSCVIDLDHVVSESAAAEGEVTLDGTQLELGSDWQLSSPTTLELLGEACDRLKEDASGLAIKFSCRADVVPII